ncbi:helix-turn-helix domain-containing protein [Sphingobacterium sp. GVS05A]|uniref:helix-turn-helix domain-containing protein n=1 Tax=Sphingobacterium TaxID=28453 RepID=UPI001CBFC89C
MYISRRRDRNRRNYNGWSHDLSIKEFAFKTGYSSPSSFSVAFKKQCGIAPNQIRKKSNTVHEDKDSFKRSDN